MKKKHVLTQDFIGKIIKIQDSDCKSQAGIQGKIIDETKNTLIIETQTGIKKVVKTQIKFTLNDQDYIINGKEISKRPEERLKMRIQNE